MGYSHGKLWTDENIENAIREVMKKAKIDIMPTNKILCEYTGNSGLSNAISKHGGWKYWAEKLNIKINNCESVIGYEFEVECASTLTSKGYYCQLTPTKYPYDILANGNIKIDVKCGRLYNGRKNESYYSFNLEKSKPTCDIFVCYCIDENSDIAKIYVIPSCILSGKTQLSVGKVRSIYDKYIDSWEVIKKYDDFYKSVVTA